MTRGKIVVVTGIPGVGKSTVLEEVKKLALDVKKLEIVNFGSVMLRYAKDMGLELHRDDLRKRSVDLQRKLQMMAAREISKMSEKVDVLIVDTHMVIKTEDGYLPGLPSYVLAELKPNSFVLIEAETSEIVRRRIEDETRVRSAISESEVNEEIEFSRAFASVCGTITGAPVKIIMNPQGKQVEAAKELFGLI